MNLQEYLQKQLGIKDWEIFYSKWSIITSAQRDDVRNQVRKLIDKKNIYFSGHSNENSHDYIATFRYKYGSSSITIERHCFAFSSLMMDSGRFGNQIKATDITIHGINDGSLEYHTEELIRTEKKIIELNSESKELEKQAEDLKELIKFMEESGKKEVSLADFQAYRELQLHDVK